MDRGGQVSSSGRGRVESRAGQLVTSNPGEVHDGSPLSGRPRRWRMVHIEPAVLNAAISAPGDTDCVRGFAIARPVIDDEPLRQVVDTLFERLSFASGDGAAHDLARDEALAAACGLLARRHGTGATGTTPPADVKRAMECLADRLVQPPSLDELARLTSTSRYQLVRRFARVCGLPPFAWLTQRRLEHARGLIARGESLATSAAASGFADQAHMTRVFTGRLGYTPGAWQRGTRGR